MAVPRLVLVVHSPGGYGLETDGREELNACVVIIVVVVIIPVAFRKNDDALFPV